MAEDQAEELESIQAIYPEFISNGHGGALEIPVKPATALLVRFLPAVQANGVLQQAYIEEDIAFDVLPPIHMVVELPATYPESQAPSATIATLHDWLPTIKIEELQDAAAVLWEEYGRGQCLFAYIDYIQNAAEEGFDVNKDGCITLPHHLKSTLLAYEAVTKQADFEKGTYDCGICLEPKKGTACHRMQRCGHVFCKKCLQDFYNNAIDEGDIATVRCLDPDCAKDDKTKAHSISPQELLMMDLTEHTVRRYLELKRKKRLENDKSTVYCPRSWCQAAARSKKYPPIPLDLLQYIEPVESMELEDSIKANEDDRLRICEKCQFAFCKTCYASWHGSFVVCRPRNPSELTAEEKASYDYIAKHTSPCPTCSSPAQKTHGCNHMNCWQCRTHFCYLCSAWLDESNPYAHFNTPGSECYQRLWELEEGDEGQAPGDGRGFAGARLWEAMAIEAAAEADAAEVLINVPPPPVPPPAPPAQPVPAPEAPRRGGEHVRGRGNPFRGRRARQPAPFPPGQQIRRHIAQQPAPGPAARQRAGDDGQRQEDELRRFIELAGRDEEDGWDSDELTDDDDAWQIR